MSSVPHNEDQSMAVTAGSTLLPSTATQTRRRTSDHNYAEEDGAVIVVNNHGHVQPRVNTNGNENIGFFRIGKYLRPGKNLSHCISVVLMILAVSTLVFKIFLMTSYLNVHSNDFLRHQYQPQRGRSAAATLVLPEKIHIPARPSEYQQVMRINRI